MKTGQMRSIASTTALVVAQAERIQSMIHEIYKDPIDDTDTAAQSKDRRIDGPKKKGSASRG